MTTRPLIRGLFLLALVIVIATTGSAGLSKEPDGRAVLTESVARQLDEGPGGPLLIIYNPTNPFGEYFEEILRTEGFNEFSSASITSVTPGILATYDLVILGETALSGDQVTMLSNWVTGGGRLIAMRPDKQLAGLLALTDAAAALTNPYLLIDTTTVPGRGTPGVTLQIHGDADEYTLSGASVLATLYSNLTTPTSFPAVTLRSVGSNGGLAAAFTYDLAHSIVLTRQGNPAAAGVDDPLTIGYMELDVFQPPPPLGRIFNRITIPQADEQQRFLDNLILYMNLSKKPLPRFWYFPRREGSGNPDRRRPCRLSRPEPARPYGPVLQSPHQPEPGQLQRGGLGVRAQFLVPVPR